MSTAPGGGMPSGAVLMCRDGPRTQAVVAFSASAFSASVGSGGRSTDSKNRFGASSLRVTLMSCPALKSP